MEVKKLREKVSRFFENIIEGINFKKIKDTINYFKEEILTVFGFIFFCIAFFTINKTLGLFAISFSFFTSVYLLILREKYINKSKTR